MSALRAIDFAQFGGPVFAGRPKGERARRQLHLDEQDKLADVVAVRIPDDTYSLNSSFFLGLFGPSVVNFKTRERFLAKYRFTAPGFVLDEIDKGIDRALTEVSPL